MLVFSASHTCSGALVPRTMFTILLFCGLDSIKTRIASELAQEFRKLRWTMSKTLSLVCARSSQSCSCAASCKAVPHLRHRNMSHSRAITHRDVLLANVSPTPWASPPRQETVPTKVWSPCYRKIARYLQYIHTWRHRLSSPRTPSRSMFCFAISSLMCA